MNFIFSGFFRSIKHCKWWKMLTKWIDFGSNCELCVCVCQEKWILKVNVLVNMVNKWGNPTFLNYLMLAMNEWIFFIFCIVSWKKSKENRRQCIKIIIIQDYWPFAVVIFTLDKRGKLPCKSHRIGFSLWETNLWMNEWMNERRCLVLVYRFYTIAFSCEL